MVNVKSNKQRRIKTGKKKVKVLRKPSVPRCKLDDPFQKRYDGSGARAEGFIRTGEWLNFSFKRAAEWDEDRWNFLAWLFQARNVRSFSNDHI